MNTVKLLMSFVCVNMYVQSIKLNSDHSVCSAHQLLHAQVVPATNEVKRSIIVNLETTNVLHICHLVVQLSSVSQY